MSLSVSGFCETTDEVFQRGIEEYRTGNYEAALDDFVLVSLLDPNNKEALKYSEESRKRLFEQRGQQLSSGDGAQRNITVSKRTVQTGVSGKQAAKVEKKLMQASDAYSSGDIPRAIKLWEQALELSPDNIEATRSISIAASTAKKLEQERQSAVEDTQEKTIVSDSVKKKLDDASRYYSAGDFNMAIKTWKDVLAVMPGNQEAKRSVQIAELSRKRLETDRKNMLADEVVRSRHYAEKGDSRGRDKVIDSKMGNAYQKYSYGDVAQAMSIWRDVLSIQPSNTEASQRMDAATQIEPIYKKAKQSYRKKDWLKANDSFLRILEIDPECPFAKRYLANIDKELKRLIDNESGSRESYYASGFFYYNQKKYKEATGEWKKAIALTRGSQIFSITESDVQDYISRANTYIEKDRLAKLPPQVKQKPKPKTSQGGQESPVQQKQQVAVDIDRSNEYYNQGLMLFSEGRINDAILSWELSLRYNPDNHKATRNIAKARNIVGK